MTPGTATWSIEAGRARWNDRSLTQWADILATEIVTIINPIEVWLFGSVASGNDNADSDIDLLLVVEADDRIRWRELDHTIRRTTTVPAPFDLAFTNPVRMSQRSSIAGTIEQAAQAKGRRLYQRA
jgi:predicted nucleotidyltransferase